MNWLVFPWLLTGILLNAGAQLLLKAGSARISHIGLNWSNLIPISFQMAFNPYIMLGLTCYAISVVIWIGVLSRTPVSIAYPLVSLGYVINAIAAYFLFAEPLTTSKMSGIFFILLGVYLIAR